MGGGRKRTKIYSQGIAKKNKNKTAQTDQLNLYNKMREKYCDPNMTSEIYFKDPANCILDFKRAYDLYDIFKERLVNQIFNDIKATGIYTDDQIIKFHNDGARQSNWTKTSFIEDKLRRKGVAYHPFKTII